MNPFERIVDVVATLLIAAVPAGPGGTALVAEDTAASADPLPFWGQVDCAEHPPGLTPAHQLVPDDGDPSRTATGARQGNSSFRRLTVYDGDDVSGERCELGLNDRLGPTAFYDEGDRRITFISIRIPKETPDGELFRNVYQNKQAQPYDSPEQASMLEMQVRDGVWRLDIDYRNVWKGPLEKGVWARFAFDVVYSQDPERGSVLVRADLDGDGVFEESSPRRHVATLRVESDGEVGPSEGASIPSHLRAGIYQDEGYECPRSGRGCSVDIDNVQVLAAPVFDRP